MNTITSSLTTAEQVNLAGVYIEAAAWNARLCKQLEDEGVNNYKWYEIPQSLHTKHEYTAISCFSACVQFIEAEFNKILEDDIDVLTKDLKFDRRSEAANNTYKQVMSEVRESLQRVSQPEKFNRYLKIGNFPRLDRQKSPYVDIDLLVNLRNAYAHYKPRWRVTLQDNLIVDKVDEVKLEQLRNRRDIAPNPLITNPLLTGINTQFFPRKVACYIYVKWAVESSLAFVEEFYRIIGRPFRYTIEEFDLSTTPKTKWEKLSES